MKKRYCPLIKNDCLEKSCVFWLSFNEEEELDEAGEVGICLVILVMMGWSDFIKLLSLVAANLSNRENEGLGRGGLLWQN